MNNSKFQRGSGCYACEICTRQTRATGEQSYGSKLCPECWEAAGLENEYQDGNRDEDSLRKALLELRAVVVAKGGSAQAFNDSVMISLDPCVAASAQPTDEGNTMKTYTNKSNAARGAKSANNGTLDGLTLQGKEGAWYYAKPAAPAAKAAPAKKSAPAKKPAAAKPSPGKPAGKPAAKKAARKAAPAAQAYDVRTGATQGRITGYSIDQDRDTKHGVTRRSAGTIGGRLWAIYDKLAAKAGSPKDLAIADVKAHNLVADFNANKVVIEFYYWRRYNGVRSRGAKQKVSA